jgi:hypothetical protein
MTDQFFNDSDEPMTFLEQVKIDHKRLLLDMAERKAKKDRDELLAWSEARQAEQPIVKSYSPPAPRRSAPVPASFSREWQDYINARVKQGDDRLFRSITEATGEVLGEMQKRLRAEFEQRLATELLTLRCEFLQQQLDATRSVTRLRPADKGSMIG